MTSRGHPRGLSHNLHRTEKNPPLRAFRQAPTASAAHLAAADNGERPVQRRSFLLAASAATAASVLATRAASAQQAQVTGAGASFPRPVYERWGQAAREPLGIQLNYQSIG